MAQPEMTKREYIATQIMSGLCVKAIRDNRSLPAEMLEKLPGEAVKLADALIAELAKLV